MKIYVLPADVYGCGHYRLIWPANVLQAQGHDITVIPPSAGQGFVARIAEMEDGSQILTGVQVPRDMDVLVIQRPAHPLQPQMIRGLRQNGVAVVVDMDDDMSSIDPRNAAYWEYSPRSSSEFSWRYALASCQEATLVTTSTRTLQRIYAKHGRGMVLDNYVPEAYLNFEATAEPGTFGWPGTLKSHPVDLQTTGRAAADLVREGWDLRIVGDGQGVRDALKLPRDPSATGTVGLVDWAARIAETMSAGMVPLAPSAFNTSKSRLKGIEMMAVGVPFVYSPREEYRRLNRESGCGLPADTPKQWYSQLKRLLTDDVLRKEQSEAGREWMRGQTYQANGWRWLEAWTRAYEMERTNGTTPT